MRRPQDGQGSTTTPAISQPEFLHTRSSLTWAIARQELHSSTRRKRYSHEPFVQNMMSGVLRNALFWQKWHIATIEALSGQSRLTQIVRSLWGMMEILSQVGHLARGML
jgi:hypothetical protein